MNVRVTIYLLMIGFTCVNVNGITLELVGFHFHWIILATHWNVKKYVKIVVTIISFAIFFSEAESVFGMDRDFGPMGYVVIFSFIWLLLLKFRHLNWLWRQNCSVRKCLNLNNNLETEKNFGTEAKTDSTPFMNELSCWCFFTFIFELFNWL